MIDRNNLPLSWLPNEVGFKFNGVKRDGSTVECVVTQDDKGMHTVAEWKELGSWGKLPC